MADDDYADDLDALTSLLDDEDDKNPYDNGEPFSVKSQHSQKVSQAVKKHVTSQDKKKRSVGSSQSSDEEKSKQQLIGKSSVSFCCWEFRCILSSLGVKKKSKKL